jgi:AcrR family transcriptional regulator
MNHESDFLDKKEESTKERILSEAVRLFCMKGFEGTSVREIVEAAGVTKPVLYYYFKNKEELFHNIIDSSLEPFNQELKDICRMDNGDFRGALEAIAESYIRKARLYPDRVRFIHAIAFSGLYVEIFDFKAHWKLIVDQVVELFRAAQEKNILIDTVTPDKQARYFMGMCQSAMKFIVFCPEWLSEEPCKGEIVEIFMKGIEKR